MELSASYHSQIRQRVAILVDGDNHPVSGLPAIEQEASRWGDVTIRRVFGDMALHKGWAEVTNFSAIHCPTSAGKNRADMALVIAAMDFAHRQLASVFVIVSDDRDFGPLVNHLREQGYRVEWVGKPKAKVSKPVSGTSVTAWVATPAQAPTPTPKPAETTALDKKLVKIIMSHPEAVKGVTLVTLGHLMKGDTVKAQTGKASWRAYLKERPLFELVGKGPDTRVRLKT